MLVLHQLLYVLFTLRGIFMHFMELIYYQDATVPVPVLCYFSIPDFYQRKYSRNWMKQKPKFLFFWHEEESKGETEKSREVATPCHGMGPPLAVPGYGVGPRASTDLVLLPIYCPRRENPKGGSLHPWKVPQHRRHRRQVSRDRSLCSGTLPGWGIAPGAISIDSTTIFIAVADSHDEEGVVLPRGWGLYR
jgi:hypothetical protein